MNNFTKAALVVFAMLILGCSTEWNQVKINTGYDGTNGNGAVICSRMPLKIARIDGQKTEGEYLWHARAKFIVSPGTHRVVTRWGHAGSAWSDYVPIDLEIRNGQILQIFSEDAANGWRPVVVDVTATGCRDKK